MNWEELEMDVHKVDKKVKTLFDALGYRKQRERMICVRN